MPEISKEQFQKIAAKGNEYYMDLINFTSYPETSMRYRGIVNETKDLARKCELLEDLCGELIATMSLEYNRLSVEAGDKIAIQKLWGYIDKRAEIYRELTR